MRDGRVHAHLLDHFPHLLTRFAARSCERFDGRDVFFLDQVFDVTERLHLAAEQDRDPVANILHIRQQVRAKR